MKPFYQSKKFWIALTALVAVMISESTGIASESAVEFAQWVVGALLVAIGLQDMGKEAEAAAIEAAINEARKDNARKGDES